MSVKDHGKYVTAGIALSAAGDIAPLPLAVAGKTKISVGLRTHDRES